MSSHISLTACWPLTAHIVPYWSSKVPKEIGGVARGNGGPPQLAFLASVTRYKLYLCMASANMKINDFPQTIIKIIKPIN